MFKSLFRTKVRQQTKHKPMS